MFTKVYLGTISISKIFLGDIPIKYNQEQPPDPQEVWKFAGHVDWVRAVAVDSQGNVYSGGDDNTVRENNLELNNK